MSFSSRAQLLTREPTGDGREKEVSDLDELFAERLRLEPGFCETVLCERKPSPDDASELQRDSR